MVYKINKQCLLNKNKNNLFTKYVTGFRIEIVNE